jgi:tRNA-dihydrouridine synthase
VQINKPVAAGPARYSKSADWEYIAACARATAGALPLVGNGDVVSHVDYYARLAAAPELATIMLARGALVKPWIFTEARRRAPCLFCRLITCRNVLGSDLVSSYLVGCHVACSCSTIFPNRFHPLSRLVAMSTVMIR